MSFRFLLLFGGSREGRYAEVDDGSAEPRSDLVTLGTQKGEGHVDAFDLADPPFGLSAGAAVEPLPPAASVL